MSEKTARAIYVEWVDSVSFGNTVWTNKDTLMEAGEPQICKSVGFLIRETADSLIVVGHMGDHQVSGDICIPKVAIKKRKWLTK